MKFYGLDSEFTFGKYQGKTIRDVAIVEPEYINWCSTHLDHFYVSSNVINEIKEIAPNFIVSEAAQTELDTKRENWKNERMERINDRDSYEDRPSYEKYNGAYGFDDDTIDSAFEGDPENYWNID